MSEYEKELTDLRKRTDPDGAEKRIPELEKLIADGHSYRFIGKVGNFCPIQPGCGGGELLRESKDRDGNLKYSSAT